MFLQVIQFLKTFADLLSSSKALGSAANRKRVGKRLLELYSLLTTIAETADGIHQELAREHSCLVNGGEPWWRDLAQLIDQQRGAFVRLQAILQRDRSLIDVYGENCGELIGRATAFKVSLLDVITQVVLVDDGGRLNLQLEHLPISLNLEDIVAFRDAAKRGDDYQGVLYYSDQFRTIIGNDAKHDEIHLGQLLGQFESFRAVEELKGARDKVAAILRTQFTIEELF